MKRICSIITIATLCIGLYPISSNAQVVEFIMPEENAVHEGTWLQWPHHFTYGMFYRNSLDPMWVQMTAAMVNSEKVHIVAYNDNQRNRIITLLENADIPMANIDFYIHENDDVWVRDNGPIFVYDANNNLRLLDWGFNGWGDDAPYDLDDAIPEALGIDLGIESIDLSEIVLEGGAVEIDGHGTMLATRSSIAHPSRNPNLTESEIENYLTMYLGITNFIWLDGVYGSEITDMHIDGFVKFANANTIVTMNNDDLAYWELNQSDISTLMSAVDVENNPYNFVILPLTLNNVSNTFGDDLGYKGSYINYYVCNDVVLVPNYNDVNDEIANNLIQGLYPGRTVIGIDSRNLYENGGMVHCVTQQQPVALKTIDIFESHDTKSVLKQNNPNPCINSTSISFSIEKSALVKIELFNSFGHQIRTMVYTEMSKGQHEIELNTSTIATGYYTYTLSVENQMIESKKLVIIK